MIRLNLSDRYLPIAAVLALALACGAAIVLGAPAELRLLAGLLLVFALPGVAVLLALSGVVRLQNFVESVALAFGLSVALSMCCFWLAAQFSGFGILTRWVVVESLFILLASGLAVFRRRTSGALIPPDALRSPHPDLPPARSYFYAFAFALVLLAALSLRLPSLGYGEYYDDELDVVQSARSLLLGQSSVVFEHRKGPTEIWLAAVAAGTATRFDEMTMRLPFALASLGAIAVTFILGEEWLGRGRGLLAALLLSGEGIFLAFSRMVQYQGVILLMVTLTAWSALHFWRARTPREEALYGAVGALCWSVGTLTHWDGLIVGVLLVYAVLHKWLFADVGTWDAMRARLRARSSDFVRALLVAAGLLIPPAVFYTQLFLHPRVTEAKGYYSGRIGFGIFNGVPEFILHATFYNASPFILALLLLVGLFMARRLTGWRRLALGLAILPFCWSSFLQVGAWNFSLVVFIVTLVFLLRSVQCPFPQKLLVVWLFAYFILYAFLIRSAGLHYYAMMPALALLAAGSLLPQGEGWEMRESRFRQFCVILVSLLLVVVAWIYGYIVYVRDQPEYALNYPRTALAVFPTLYQDRPRDFFFGFPYRYGWSVVGELYRRGVMRGKFESNETYLVTDWYVRDLEVARNDEARYYLRVDDAPRGGAVPPDLGDRFHPWGEVRVRSEVKIRIYERKGYAPASVRIYHAEDFPADDPQRLARSLVYKQARGDDHAFRELGRFLDNHAGAQDVIVLDTPLQDAIVPYYYRGEARLAAVVDAAALGEAIQTARVVYASLWAAGDVERQLAVGAYPVESRWFGSVRLVTYAPPSAPDAGAPVISGTPKAVFGDVIQLSAYSLEGKTVRPGEVVRLNFKWQATAPISTRYKIFLHVLDAQDKIVAQRDAEPMAELAPTTSWQVGEFVVDRHGIRLPANLPPQTLRLAVGFYDPQSGARLPARDAHGNPLPDNRLLIEGLEIK